MSNSTYTNILTFNNTNLGIHINNPHFSDKKINHINRNF